MKKELNIDSSWGGESPKIKIELNTQDKPLYLQIDEDNSATVEECSSKYIKEILQAAEKEQIEEKIKDSCKEDIIETFEDNENDLTKELKKYGYE